MGVRLWAPGWGNNRDLVWIEIPGFADKQGIYYILRKHYTTTRPASWISQEMAVRHLAKNTTVISRHIRGVQGYGQI